MAWHVLFLGDHSSKQGDGCVHLINHTSSSSLIVDEDKLILVDTGNRHQFDALKAGVEELGYSLEDITDVVLTHFHLDHASNLALLPHHVNVYAWMHNWKYGETIRIGPRHRSFAKGTDCRCFPSPPDCTFGA